MNGLVRPIWNEILIFNSNKRHDATFHVSFFYKRNQASMYMFRIVDYSILLSFLLNSFNLFIKFLFKWRWWHMILESSTIYWGDWHRMGVKSWLFLQHGRHLRLLKWNQMGILFSNGPGDPSAIPYAVETVKVIMGNVPIFWNCMGHQLLGQALGGKT